MLCVCVCVYVTETKKEYSKKYISESMYTSPKSTDTYVILGNLLSYWSLTMSSELCLGDMRDTYKG